MSLYRQPGRVARRTIVLVALAALAAGLAIGYALGNAGGSESSVASELSHLRDRLAPVGEGLELAPGEYAQGVRGGRVVSQAEYSGALGAVNRSKQVVASNRGDLRALSVRRAGAVESAIDGLLAAMRRHADPASVERLAGAASAALSAATAP